MLNHDKISPAEDSSPTIEVTTAMADAGANAIDDWADVSTHDYLARMVYIAMETIRRATDVGEDGHRETGPSRTA